jgi:hypothetical protein
VTNYTVSKLHYLGATGSMRLELLFLTLPTRALTG